MTAPATKNRATVRFGPQLTTLLDGGHCAGRSRSERLETLASRYLTMIGQHPSWPVDTWIRAIKAGQQIDLASPGAIWALIGLAKQQRDSKLSYSLENAPPAQAISVLAIIETYLATGQDASPESVQAFLEKQDVTLPAI